jgi:hypothetical protein
MKGGLHILPHFTSIAPRTEFSGAGGGWAILSHCALITPRTEFSGAASFAIFFSAKGAGLDVAL